MCANEHLSHVDLQQNEQLNTVNHFDCKCSYIMFNLVTLHNPFDRTQQLIVNPKFSVSVDVRTLLTKLLEIGNIQK